MDYLKEFLELQRFIKINYLRMLFGNNFEGIVFPVSKHKMLHIDKNYKIVYNEDYTKDYFQND